MKKVLTLTNKYLIIATPLLLFLFFICLYFMFMMQNGQGIRVLFGFILIFFMSVAFVAGWGNMVKSAVNEQNYDEPYLIIKDFIPGVGEYFLSVLGAIVLFVFVNILVYAGSYFAGMHFIGDIGVSSEALSKAMSGQEALKSFLYSLDVQQLVKLNLWNILLLSVTTVMYFFFMFYFPALFLESKNPLKAIIITLQRTFCKKFLSNIGIYLVIFVINFIISILSALFAGNYIMNFIMSLVNFYFICAVAIGVFYYYNKTFINSHLGSSIDTYI